MLAATPSTGGAHRQAHEQPTRKQTLADNGQHRPVQLCRDSRDHPSSAGVGSIADRCDQCQSEHHWCKTTALARADDNQSDASQQLSILTETKRYSMTNFSIDAIMGNNRGSSAPATPPISNNSAGYTLSTSSSASASNSTSAATKRSRPKKYQCPFCWVALSNSGQFKGHMRIHTGERPFKCDQPFCDKTFTRNEELTRHKRIHTGERPYACLQCNKSFGRKDHLKKHTRTHERHAAHRQQHQLDGAYDNSLVHQSQQAAASEQLPAAAAAANAEQLVASQQALCMAPLKVATSESQLGALASPMTSLGCWPTPALELQLQQQLQLQSWYNFVSPEQLDLLYRLSAMSGVLT